MVQVSYFVIEHLFLLLEMVLHSIKFLLID